MSSTQEGSRTDALAIAAFVFGLISIPLAFFPFGMFPGPIAIVLGLIARNRPGSPSGRQRFARAAIYLGAASIILWLTIFVVLWLIGS